MVLYNLSLEPYTFSSNSISVTVEKIDNKRYTMRDIGKLEKRIEDPASRTTWIRLSGNKVESDQSDSSVNKKSSMFSCNSSNDISLFKDFSTSVITP